jgi:hypothetical protein
MVATVSTTGLATTLTEGAATISASFQSITGSTSLTATSLTVQVSVVASDLAGHPLTYTWQSTDGTIQNVNSATTTWTLPDGPGLHFAYVLVSNGFGGYTERRLAVNTDTIGTPLIVPSPLPFAPPAFTGEAGATYRGFLTGGNLTTVSSFPGASSNWKPGIPVSIPDIGVLAFDPTHNVGSLAKSNVRGEFVYPMDNSGYIYQALCDSVPGFPTSVVNPLLCGSFGSPLGLSISDYGNSFDAFSQGNPATPALDVAGEFLLQDGSTCGIVDEFFGVEVVPTATLLDSSGNVLAGPVRANQWGDYDLPTQGTENGTVVNGASVSLQCENNSAIVIPIPTPLQNPTTELPVATVLASSPTVTSMTATLNSTQVGQLLPPPTGPSDIVPLGDAFLAEKGLDSRIGACQYYQKVGAVQGCDAVGNFQSPITFNDWKSQVNIDQYALNPSNPGGGLGVYQATYINKFDLNLARVHHAVSNGYPPSPSTQATVPYTYVANYVCNHLGPQGPNALNPPQTGTDSIDSVIQSVVNGQNLVACVAMDYSTFPTPAFGGAPNGFYGPYIRFLIFGPSGQLLPSVNLDGRREKFVPGTCVVCHGGDHYAGKYDGASIDVGGHFLPYDTGNFEFSDQPGLTEADQEQSIYTLNQLIQGFSSPTVPPVQFATPITTPSVTPAEQELIANWYTTGQTACPPGTSPCLNKSYVEPNWQTAGGDFPNIYANVYARSCRTCHVALPSYNFEQNPGLGNAGPVVDPANCPPVPGGGGFGQNRNRMYKMPNSLTTFNIFWGSHNSPTEFDQVTAFHQFLNCLDNATANAVPTRTVSRKR